MFQKIFDFLWNNMAAISPAIVSAIAAGFSWWKARDSRYHAARLEIEKRAFDSDMKLREKAFESRLNERAKAIEAELNQIASVNQMKFAALHPQRVPVIKELYKRILSLLANNELIARDIRGVNIQDQPPQHLSAWMESHKDTNELKQFVADNRLLFDQEICALLDQVCDNVTIFDFSRASADGIPAVLSGSELPKGISELETLETVKKRIEEKFRGLLGV